MSHTVSETTCQIGNEMSERNRKQTFEPDCAHCLRSERNRRFRSEPNRRRILGKIFLLKVLTRLEGCACCCEVVEGVAEQLGTHSRVVWVFTCYLNMQINYDRQHSIISYVEIHHHYISMVCKQLACIKMKILLC